MKASVIVPAWGNTPYIAETRAALAAQTLGDFETLECAPPEGEENAGAARNGGLARAKGDWVFFVDADDLPGPDFLSAAVELGERTGADIVAFRADEVDDRLGGRAPMPYLRRLSPWADGRAHGLGELGSARFTTLGLAPWNKAVRRAILADGGVRFQSIRRADDIAFTVALLDRAATFAALDRSLIGYRVNNAASQEATSAETPTAFYDALLEAKRRLCGRHGEAMKELARETIAYGLHSVRTLSAYRALCAHLAGRAKADFGVEPRLSALKASNQLCFKAVRALETLRDRGPLFCLRRLAGKAVR